MDYLSEAARTRPDAPALITGDGVVTYRDLDDLASRVGTAVLRAGPALSDRVGFWAENSIAGVAAAWGIPRAGAWAVPISATLPPARSMELSRIAGVKGLWALPDGRDTAALRPASDELPGGGPPQRDARYVVFTSGTSGTPKGVIITGETIEASAAASQQRLGNGADDAWLCVLPLTHIGGLSILWRSARQAAPVLLEDGFDVERVAGLLGGGSAAYVSLVPTMLRRLLGVHPGPYRGVKGVLIGGGPAGSELLERARAAGLPVLATYGMTETSSQIVTSAPDDAGGTRGSVGRSLDGAEIRIVDADGSEMDHGEPGTIEVRGPMVSPGYVGEPEREAGDWFRTSDLGVIDPDGYLTVLGRADDVIVTGGENVHPAVVEAVVLAHPSVAETMVYGAPDAEWGSAVVAEIVPAAGSVWDEADTVAFVRARLAGCEVPKRWLVVERIERGKLGKPRRTGE